MGLRQTVAAGRFYDSNANTLKKEIITYTQESERDKLLSSQICGIIAPHAGYMFSGEMAGRAYSRLKNLQYDVVCIISPSHTEYFNACSIFPGEAYATPLGNVPINKSICDEIVSESSIEYDKQGHLSEHALEVQLPFLQVMLGDNLSIIPIIMGAQNDKQVTVIANMIQKLIEKYKNTILFVASTDLSHFHSYDKASKMDNKLIQYLTDYDYEGLWNALDTKKIEACGGGPMVSVMKGLDLPGREITSLGYTNSGDIIPDKSSVVGYTSAIITMNEV